jgi:geranylgeranyl diphosphate synthase type II
MIAGQTMDLEFSNRADDLKDAELEQIQRFKTGKLIAAPVLIPSILTNYKNYFELEDFAQNLGLLFQIADDILDEEGSFEKVRKTIGKDQAKNKFTFVKAYGLNGAKIQADLYASNCVTVLDALNGDVTFLHDLVGYVRTRDR